MVTLSGQLFVGEQALVLLRPIAAEVAANRLSINVCYCECGFINCRNVLRSKGEERRINAETCL